MKVAIAALLLMGCSRVEPSSDLAVVDTFQMTSDTAVAVVLDSKRGITCYVFEGKTTSSWCTQKGAR